MAHEREVAQLSVANDVAERLFVQSKSYIYMTQCYAHGSSANV